MDTDSLDIWNQCVSSELDIAENYVTIDSVTVSSGQKPGDGYLCDMKAVSLKATVKGKVTQHDYVVKSIPKSKARADFVSRTNLFDVECDTYHKLIPALNTIKMNGDYHVSVPKCYFTSKERGIIVMENLLTKGFTMPDKKKGLEIEETKMVLIQLANLHASSYHLEGRLKEECRFLDRGRLHNFGNDDLSDTILEIFTNPVLVFLRVMKILWKDDVILLDRLKEFEQSWEKNYREALKYQGDFLVCIVVDVWVNNMMFRRDSTGKPLEVKIYDFQGTCKASPVYDVMYLLMTSVPPALRKENLQELLQFYHSKLDERLAFYGHEDVYSLEQLQRDYNDQYIYGFVASHPHTQVDFAPPDDSVAFEFSQKEDPAEQRRNQEQQKQHQMNMAMKIPAIRKRMEELAEEAMEMGLF